MDMETEMKEVASKLEKSQEVSKGTSAKESLIKALIGMGAGGIKSKLGNMSRLDKVTLVSVLKSMDKSKLKVTIDSVDKAVEFDEINNVKFHQGDVHGSGADGKNGKGSVIQEDVADDDIDETLVKPAAANQNHQGDQTPLGREENKVEDPEDSKDKKKKKIKKSQYDIYAEVFSNVKEGITADALYGDFVSKGYDVDTLSVVGDMIKFAIMENNRHSESTMESNPMYKALKEMCSKGHSRDYMKGYGMAKGGVGENDLSKMIVDVMKAHGDDMEKAEERSAEMFKNMYKMMRAGKSEEEVSKSFDGEDSSKISKMYSALKNSDLFVGNPEEKQSRDEMEKLQQRPVRGDKTRPKDLKLELDNKAAQDNIDDLSQKDVKKSIEWPETNRLFEAGSLGRGPTYSVNTMYKSSIAVLDAIKALQKSEKVNDTPRGTEELILKGLDALPGEVLTKAALAQQKMTPAPSSFDISEISNGLRITTEEQAKILGD